MVEVSDLYTFTLQGQLSLQTASLLRGFKGQFLAEIAELMINLGHEHRNYCMIKINKTM